MIVEYSLTPREPIQEAVTPNDRRHTTDRRANVQGGRRLRDPITNLHNHPHRDVTPQQLGPWWGVTATTVLRWIQLGHPRYGRLLAFHDGTREWLVLTADAIAFENRLFNPPIG